MKVRRGSRRLTRVTGSAVLALGLAAGAVAGSGAVASAGSVARFPTRSGAVGWGNNFVGELGDGINFQVASPTWTPVTGLSSSVVQVSVGFEQSMALTSDGSAAMAHHQYRRRDVQSQHRSCASSCLAGIIQVSSSGNCRRRGLRAVGLFPCAEYRGELGGLDGWTVPTG